MALRTRTLGRAIWRALRGFYREVRKTVGGSDEPGGAALVVRRDVEAMEGVLGRAYFAPNWEFSYYERGEDLNLARVEHEDRTVDGERYQWWQTHVRGWQYDEDGETYVRLRPHHELEPTENDQAHIDGVGLSVLDGVDDVAAVLDDARVAYERYDDFPPGRP